MDIDDNGEENFFTYTDSYGAVLSCKTHTLYTPEELIAKFGWEEYFVFALMLMVSILIGVFFWWKGQNDNAEYMMGGKNMGTLPMTMSLIARFTIYRNCASGIGTLKYSNLVYYAVSVHEFK